MSQQFPHFKTLKELYYEFLIPIRQRYRLIEERGIKVDFDQRKKLNVKYSEMLAEKHERLNSLAGWKVNFNSNAGKNGQVPKLIWGELGCPVRKDVADKTLTALKSNVLSKHYHWNKAIEVIDLVLECRKIHKLINTYIKARPDIDGRMRTRYRLTLETGRTSTNILKPPDRYQNYGMAFQTISKYAEFGQDLRSMLIVDDGMIGVEVDGSQAEARVVMLLAEEYDLLERMDDPLFDLHILTTSWAYTRQFEDLKIPGKTNYFNKKAAKAILGSDGEPLRQKGKKLRHAGNYDMGAGEASLLMNVPQNKAKASLDIFHKFSPNIKGIFHKSIQECLAKDRTLWTPDGGRREFFEKWGDKLFKEAYAHIPQRVITQLTKWALLTSGITDVLMESHDSFTFQCRPEELDNTLSIVKPLMEAEIDFQYCSIPRGKLSIPMEAKVYHKNFYKGEDYKC